MPTFKLELYTAKTLSDGRHPVCIRVTHNGRARKTIASATTDEWDSKNARIKPRSRKDYNRVNMEIEDEFNKYEAIFLALKKGFREWKPGDVFSKQVISSPLFSVNSLQYIEYLKGRLTYSYTSAQASHNKIIAYGGDFTFSDITKKWLNGLTNFLKAEPYNNGDNTIKGVIKYIKRVAKYAGTENQVLKDTKISYSEPLKPKLTLAELGEIIKLELSGQMNLARNTFLLQYYFWGIRIGDLLLLKQWDVSNGRLTYKASKTGKVKSIPISDRAMDILKEYLDPSKFYLLPWMRVSFEEENFENYKKLVSEVKNRTMIINRNLKFIAEKAGIGKNLSTHIARHTFASLGDKILEGNLEILQQMLGHSSRAMTERYVNDLRKSDVLDAAAKKIFD